MLQQGQVAPDFALVDQDGQVRRLSEHRGSWVVLYFYPKDDTLGCTKEACAFRDAMPDFEGIDAVVFGVSADDQESHREFASKFELNFPLLADEQRQVIDAYHAYGEKLVGDELREGILRRTYLIDPNGKIARSWEVEDPESHAAEVIEAVREAA